MNTHQLLKIQSVDRLTPSAVAISFELPSALAADYAFKAGQYLGLEAKIDGEVVRRSYSLCSAPHENVLKVGVKKVQKGLFDPIDTTDLDDLQQQTVLQRIKLDVV